jgi:hypothetical protein
MKYKTQRYPRRNIHSSLVNNALLRANSGTQKYSGKKYVAYVHDAAEEHGTEGDINVGPLLTKAVEQFKAHVSVWRDKVVVADNACSCGCHSVKGM